MKRVLTVRAVIAVIALVIAIGAYVLTLPQADAFGGICTYYETAAKKKVVGQRGSDCCGVPVSWGVVTPYRTCEQVYCAGVWCPPPTE